MVGTFFFDVGLTITFGRPLHLPLLESIEIKYPLNVEDEEIENIGEDYNLRALIKPYPTIYDGFQQEARLSKISYKIYSYITKVSGVDSNNLKMSGLIELNSLIVAFASSLPQYFKEDDALASKSLREVCPPTWFKINLDGTLSIPKWFDFTRRRIIWRYKNIQILMFRSFIWESGKFFDGGGMEKNISMDVELRELLESCIKKCYLAAKDTINSIGYYVSNCEVDITSSWYATYYVFQAVLIPILLLHKRSTERYNRDVRQWVNDIEQTKRTLISLQGFNSLAKNLVETIDILTQPLIKDLDEPDQNNTQGSDDSEMDMAKSGFEFAGLHSATINLFSNIGVDYGQSASVPNMTMENDRFDQLISQSENNDGLHHDESLASEETVINTFLQQELFPNDPIFEDSQQYKSYNLRRISK